MLVQYLNLFIHLVVMAMYNGLIYDILGERLKDLSVIAKLSVLDHMKE